MNMEKYNINNEQIRDLLDAFLITPDEMQKELFLKKASAVISKNKRRKQVWIISGLIGIISIFTLLSLELFLPVREPKMVIHSTNSLQTQTQTKIILSNSVIPISKKPNINTTTNNSFTTEQSYTSSSSAFRQDVSQNEIIQNETSKMEEPKPVLQTIIQTEQQINGTETLSQDTTKEEQQNQNNPIPKEKLENKASKLPRKANDWETFVTLFYRPEMIFNIIDNDKYIHNAGIEFTFHPFNPRYVIRTGLGLSFSKGSYEYKIDYNQYLGSYDKLDSISFSIASNGFNLIPHYFFSNEDVYNELLDSYYTKIYKKFIYFQIPLEIGYDFYKRNSFSMGFRTGPTLSLLLNQQSTELILDPSKDKIIQINRITPDRIAANWQYMIGFNMTKVINRVVIEVEPRITYYFNSVYEKGDQTQAPYSFNIRLAVGIK